MKQQTKSFDSQVSGSTAEYLYVENLPTGFRSYPEKMGQLYVRGLFFEESLALSKYIGNRTEVDYAQIISLYSDCIRGIDIRDLEAIDLKVLMIMSSIWTVKDFGWDPSIPCPQILDNGDRCTGLIDERIVLDDFDFDAPKIKRVPVPIKIGDTSFDIGPLTVGDLARKKQYLENHPNLDEGVYDYACMIKNDISLEEKIKAIRFGNRQEVLQIKRIDNDLYIGVSPMEKQCNSCKKKGRVYIGFDEIKAYP